MSRRSLVMAAACLVVVASCSATDLGPDGAGDPEETSASSPSDQSSTSSPSDDVTTEAPETEVPSSDGRPLNSRAAEAFGDVQEHLEELHRYRFRGTITTDQAVQDIDVEAQAGPVAFRAQVEATSDAASSSMEVLRVSGVTWVKAASAYWRTLGYDEESAQRADGRYVVFEQAQGDAVWSQYDPTGVLDYVAGVDAADAEIVGGEAPDSERITVRVREAPEFDGASITLEYSVTDPSAPVRLDLDDGETSLSAEVVEIREEPDITVPLPDEVVQADEA